MHDNDNHDPNDPIRPYKVGKGKAPKEHQFQKGKPSANPFGRPRKDKMTMVQKPQDTLVSLIAKIDATVVGMRGEEEITQLQYILEAQAKAARQGDPRARREHLKLSKAAHEEIEAAALELFQTAIVYKHYWTPIFEHRERSGQELPNQLPDPRDLIVDPMTGQVRMVGAVDEESKAQQDMLLATRDLAYEMVEELGSRKTLSGDLKRSLQKSKRVGQKCNAMLPPRLQKPIPWVGPGARCR